MLAIIEDRQHSGFLIKKVRFLSIGDIMPRHIHTGRGHLTIGIEGKVRSIVTNYDDVIMGKGGIVFWPIGTEHEWIALEAPSVIVNIFII